MLNPKAFALSGGILWGLGMAVLTLLAMQTGYAAEMMEALTKLYPGYELTWLGALVGALWGFLDAFLGLWIFAWLYNKLAKK